MLYFFDISVKDNVRKKRQLLIFKRRKRKLINNNPVQGKYFTRGDISKISYWKGSYVYSFDGICLGLKKKLTNINNSFILRNIKNRVGIEFTILYYFSKVFKNIVTLDYKRKAFTYKSAKLYYIRYLRNKASKI